SGGQKAIEGGRRPATLDITKLGHPGLNVGASFDFSCERLANPAETIVPVDGVALIFVQKWFIGMGVRIFRDHHDRKGTAVFFALLEQSTYTRDSKRMFRNQDCIRATGDATVCGNPSCMTAHDFDHHYAVLRLSRGMQTINTVGND